MTKEKLEEAAEIYEPKLNKWTIQEIFKDGAKWQQERMYSEEDLRNAFFSFPDEWICFEEWFEQFKKKCNEQRNSI